MHKIQQLREETGLFIFCFIAVNCRKTGRKTEIIEFWLLTLFLCSSIMQSVNTKRTQKGSKAHNVFTKQKAEFHIGKNNQHGSDRHAGLFAALHRLSRIS